jgi:hypothetical protein
MSRDKTISTHGATSSRSQCRRQLGAPWPTLGSRPAACTGPRSSWAVGTLRSAPPGSSSRASGCAYCVVTTSPHAMACRVHRASRVGCSHGVHGPRDAPLERRTRDAGRAQGLRRPARSPSRGLPRLLRPASTFRGRPDAASNGIPTGSRRFRGFCPRRSTRPACQRVSIRPS